MDVTEKNPDYNRIDASRAFQGMHLNHNEYRSHALEDNYSKGRKVSVTHLEVRKASTSVNARKSVPAYQECSSGGSYIA